MTRKEACYFLGIREGASEEQIKRAYRYKAKLYHPDANPNTDTKDYYIRVQKAYECLMNDTTTNPAGGVNPAYDMNAGMYRNNSFGSSAGNAMYGSRFASNTSNANFSNVNFSNVRPAKVYASTATAQASYKRQKEKEKEHEKIQKWDAEYKNNKKRQQQAQLYGKEYTDRMTGTSRSKEEEILEKIRAIWLAETIKRQIELDKEHKEVLQRRKVYQAFMQQKIQDEDSVKGMSQLTKNADKVKQFSPKKS